MIGNSDFCGSTCSTRPATHRASEHHHVHGWTCKNFDPQRAIPSPQCSALRTSPKAHTHTVRTQAIIREHLDHNSSSAEQRGTHYMVLGSQRVSGCQLRSFGHEGPFRVVFINHLHGHLIRHLPTMCLPIVLTYAAAVIIPSKLPPLEMCGTCTIEVRAMTLR
jgi:hypothetical protein